MNNIESFNSDKTYVDFMDPTSIIKYIIKNYEKFLLLLLVFVIVYFIEHITQINAIIYGSSSISNIGLSQNNTNTNTNKNINTKEIKKRTKSKK
jgi:hypothetical protein